MQRRQTPETALGLAISAYNGPKELSAVLDSDRFENRPESGARWISHCLDPDRREKFSPGSIVKIFRFAHANGAHDGFAMLARLCGYNMTPIIATEAVVMQLQSQLAATKQDVAAMERDIATLGELTPQQIALAAAMHRKDFA